MCSYNETIEGDAPHIHRGTVLYRMGNSTPSTKVVAMRVI